MFLRDCLTSITWNTMNKRSTELINNEAFPHLPIRLQVRLKMSPFTNRAFIQMLIDQCFQINNLDYYHLEHSAVSRRAKRSADDVLSRLRNDERVSIRYTRYSLWRESCIEDNV